MSEKSRERLIKKCQREHERHCREWKERGFIEIITPTGRGEALWFPEDQWHMNCGQYYGPEGMVEIFRHTDRSHLELRTVHNRKVIRRIFDKPGTKPLYSFKFIPILCRRFLKEISQIDEQTDYRVVWNDAIEAAAKEVVRGVTGGGKLWVLTLHQKKAFAAAIRKLKKP